MRSLRPDADDPYFTLTILPQAIGRVTCEGTVPSEPTLAGKAWPSGTPCTMGLSAMAEKSSHHFCLDRRRRHPMRSEA
ncbi:hypothetical protein NXC24_PC00073 (plasmid) [Rhizobium sp. NXC24]|nr:hypothetical protein NXC24_PC00073 [Rhizobium sp. NXC24]